jgi:thiamine biosynthesis lipoprotein
LEDAAIPQAPQTKDDSGLHRFAHEAMTTVFEVVIAGETGEYARQASQAVFGEIDRLEGVLSRFIESSDISRINKLGAREPVRVGADTFECLQTAAAVHRVTGGAFDVTIGAVTTPDGERLPAESAPVGMGMVEFHEDIFAISLKAEGLSIDLGGIGKGFALDKALEILGDWSVDSVLLHGGESSVLGIGAPPDEDGWPVAAGGEQGERFILRDKALSGSGIYVKGSHIIDPGTRRPAEGKTGAWAFCPSAAVADALSTAFMVMPPPDIERFCRNHPGTGAMFVVEQEGDSTLTRLGDWAQLGEQR